ncbi:MAG: 4-hydroxy-3-methylbut-2-enyl diphosphate reductase [alpha proteobacterium HIMB59]|nr:MAG: 4-hydroxy-3-methylbut-2-enyl diphosphate reductase [alpha proteobacterium HIMB59]
MLKKILTAKHRGFCAGVERAVEIVEKSLIKYGAPVYVRHEIVHNKFVVNNLKKKGVIFVESLDEVPKETNQPVIFSAHGVAKRVIEKAKNYNLLFYDAICPLVSKIHKEITLLESQGFQIIMIGHEGHPEVEGTAGQLKDMGNLTLVQTLSDVEKLYFSSEQKLAYITQTTLSVFDTQEIVDALEKKFPEILAPKKSDICYATSNRQSSVQDMASKVDAIFVVGAFNSSNSIRLVETAKRFGCEYSELIENIDNFDYAQLGKFNSIGLTASASAPEEQLNMFIEKIKSKFPVEVTDYKEDESIIFKVPNFLN